MRFRRIAAIGGATVLVAGSALLVATPAAAETVIDNVTFYGESDFGVEVASTYPTGVDWFVGEDTDDPPAGTLTFTADGLVINDGSGTNGVVQILNQNVTTPATAGELIDLIDDVDVIADGVGTFQLPLFADGEGDAGFTTLRPSASQTTDVDIQWITSSPIIGTGTEAVPQYTAEASAALPDLLDAVYGGAETPELLGYGFWVGPDETLELFAVSWDDSWNIFAPPPTRTGAPTTLTPEESATTGITITGTNWRGTGPLEPGEGGAYYLDIYLCSDDEVEPDYTVTAQYEDGTIILDVVFDDPLPLGEYCVVFDDNNSEDGYYGLIDSWNDEVPAFSFTVAEAPVDTDDDSDTDDDELAATGAEPAQPLLIASGLMLAGLGVLAAFRLRRRNA